MYRFAIFLACLLPLNNTQAQSLTFEQAVQHALAHDHKLNALHLKQQASQQSELAVAFLPNPLITLGVMNASADGFDLNQQAMTQQQIKYSQKLPQRGAYDLKKSKARLFQQQAQWQYLNRQALVKKDVSLLWLAAHQAQALADLYKQHKSVLEKAAAVITNNYASGNEKTLQADVLQAEMAVSLMDQKIRAAEQEQSQSMLSLTEWSIDTFQQVDSQLPKFISASDIDQTNHPKIKALQTKADMAALETKEKQLNKKTQWGFSAAYGVRNNDELGMPREDLISLTFSFDLPRFNRKHQDASITQAALLADATEHEWQQALNQMQATLASKQQLAKLSHDLYLNHAENLIPQSQQIELARKVAYSHGSSDLSQWLNVQQQTLSLKTEAIKHQHQWLKQSIEVQYLHTQINDTGAIK